MTIARRVRRATVGAVLWAAAAAVGGCNPVSQVAWSPDGKHAMYTAAGPTPANAGSGLTVLDGDGHVSGQLPRATGEVHWSADSTTAYFGGDDHGGPRPVPVSHQWVGGADEPAPASTAAAAAVWAWRDGRVDRPVAIDRATVTAVHPSPDGRWLVIEAAAGPFSFRDLLPAGTPAVTGGGPGLYAYAIATGHLYRLDGSPTPHAFTGPNRLSLVESTGPNVGQIVEQTLDESAAKPARRPLVAVLPDATPPPQMTAAGVLFMTTAGTFPAPPSAAAPVTALYRLTAAGRIDRLADATTDVGLTFAVSPDGRRVLFCQRPTASGPTELAVMDADGSHRHALLDLSTVPGGHTIVPAWHGNDRVTFAALAAGQPIAARPNRAARTAFDVADYDVPPDGPMRPVATLSRDWAADLKPSEPAATPQPTPQPLSPAVPSRP